MLMRKHIILYLIAAVALVSCGKSSGGDGGRAIAVSLNKDKIDLYAGETFTLTALVYPQALNMDVDWSITDPTFASIEGGVVTAVTEGVTYAVATSKDGFAKASCLVNVMPPYHYRVFVNDSEGNQVKSINTYPSFAAQYTAVTSEENAASHTYTWTSTVPDFVSVENGALNIGWEESATADYLYSSEAMVSVSTEDGYGTSIPVRATILKGFTVNTEEQAIGTTYDVEAETEYHFQLWYEGESMNLPVPSTAYELTSSNTDNFTVSQVADGYKLLVGEGTELKTTVSVTFGDGRTIELCDARIPKNYVIKASCTHQYTSALVFSWTEGESDADDASRAYTLNLYEDEQCTVLYQSFSVPAVPEIWSNKAPRYIFGGLKPDTSYWFKVVETDNPDRDSDIIRGRTEAFTVVTLPEVVDKPGIILAEDFGEICWDFDYNSAATGFMPADKGSFSNAEVSSSTNTGNKIYNGYHVSGGGGEISYSSCSSAISKSRLAGWAYDTNVYVHPGYLKLGTSSSRGWILTPEIPLAEGKKAKVTVSVTARNYNSSQDAAWCVAVLTREQAKVEGIKASFDWPSTSDADHYREANFTQTYSTQVVKDLVIGPNDRITFGGRQGGSTSKGRAIIADITLEVTEIINVE